MFYWFVFLTKAIVSGQRKYTIITFLQNAEEGKRGEIYSMI